MCTCGPPSSVRRRSTCRSAAPRSRCASTGFAARIVRIPLTPVGDTTVESKPRNEHKPARTLSALVKNCCWTLFILGYHGRAHLRRRGTQSRSSQAAELSDPRTTERTYLRQKAEEEGSKHGAQSRHHASGLLLPLVCTIRLADTRHQSSPLL